MSASRIVTVKQIIPLFKGEEQANAIELVLLEEVGNTLVAQKDLYRTGDRALFIEPDYCLSEIPLFKEYLEPMGDKKKCKLGRNNRIRAIKFNLHTGNSEPVYSYGILIHAESILEYTGFALQDVDDWDTVLGITKYEEPEPYTHEMQDGKVVTCPFPEQMYKTDETNINNVINEMQFPMYLIGTHKSDGSSISIWYRNGKSGICSRKQGKPLIYNKCIGWKKAWWQVCLEALSFRLYRSKGVKIYEMTESDDQFVVMGKPYLEKLTAYGKNIVLRGEMVGKSCRGSGNPNNPKARESNHIEFYGIDDYNHYSTKLPYKEVEAIAEELGIQLVHKYFETTFNSIHELLTACQEIFNMEKDGKKIIEGVVVRNESGSFSAKVMNLEYDSKK